MEITFDTLPSAVEKLLWKMDHIEKLLNQKSQATQLPQFIPIKKAAEITGKTPNALRVQISLGNLKSIKKSGTHFFDTEYLMKWISGDVEDESMENPSEILKPLKLKHDVRKK